MSKQYSSFRELIADALSPKPAERGTPGAMVATKLQFTPSVSAVQKADEVGRIIRRAMDESKR